MLEKPTPFITPVPLQLILSRRALPATSGDCKCMCFIRRVRFEARSAIDEAIMSVAHPRLSFLKLLWWSFLHLHDMVRIFVAFSPSCAKVAVQKEAEQMYAIGEGFFFSILI